MEQKRRNWSSPKLTRLVAGQAEGKKTLINCDNQSAQCNSSNYRS